ncbi:MAG: dihydroorotate dehydrogenase electron transfer subunit [Bacteroidales bacterium]|jgi:dihydroorotate dehydrogenase electron transfer subunit|nr:dihydroorotate dehydrogenase electron transfer subunit [Bacteroidales bacterium]
MKYCKDFIVVGKEMIRSDLFILKLQYQEEVLPEIKPGQFVEILIKDKKDVLLRRPISIHDVSKENNQISLVIQIVGKGTEELSKIEMGNSLNLIFPLGNGFSLIGNKVLLIGGGVGAAPLLYLARCLKEKGTAFNTLIGSRDTIQLFNKDKFSDLGPLHIATENGSCGFKGLVTEHPIMEEDFDAVYCCGPTIMMQKVASIMEKRNIPCFVSLEHKMACGFGVCLCCVVDTDTGNKRTCINGPVFLSSELKNF